MVNIPGIKPKRHSVFLPLFMQFFIFFEFKKETALKSLKTID